MSSTPSSKPVTKKTPVFKFFVGGKSKVRSGCATCKIRRIKCDEGKPGRHCDGYPEPQMRKKRGKKSPEAEESPMIAILSKRKVQQSLPLFPDCTPQESRLLYVFLRHSIEVMTPWHGGNFWQDHVPKRGHFESATRHAMIAMAATHENMQFMRSAIPNDPRMEPSLIKARKNYALYHYGRSVSELARTLSEGRSGAEEIALINCVIYIVVDFLWGNVATSIAHLHSGSRILEQWKKKLPKGKRIEAGSLEANLITVYDTMGHSADRSQEEPEQAPGTPSPIDFPDLPAARRSIERLASDGLKLARQSAIEGDEPDAAERRRSIQSSEDEHSALLEEWKEKFDRLLKSFEQKPNRQESKSDKEDTDTMLMLYLSAIVWLWDGRNPSQEQPLKLFGQLVQIAECMVAEANSSVEESNRVRMIIFDSRIWPSLAILAAKCEDLDLRSRAIALLAKTRPNPTRDASPESDNDGLKKSIPEFTATSAGNWSTWVEMTASE